MKQSNLYTIHDSKAEFYRPPFVARSKGEAIRMFAQGANDKETQLAQHPEDFTLYQIGTFDDITGQIHHEPHISLGKAIDYVRKDIPMQHMKGLPT